MYFWNTYPFVRLATILILGIVGYDLFPSLWNQSILLLSIGIFLCVVSLAISNGLGYFKLRHLNGILGLIVFFLVGGEVVRLRYHSLPEIHYTNYVARIDGFSGLVVSEANERKNYYRYDLLVGQILAGDSSIATSGKIHLYVKKDSSNQKKMGYGDVVLVYGGFFRVPGPGNPNEFDYRKYLRRQNIFSQAFKNHTEVQVFRNSPPNWLLSLAYKIRGAASEIIDRNVLSNKERGITLALLLGIKDHLDSDVRDAYASAGAMHVLAVSGLHVGIVYLMLQFLFGRLRATLFGRQIFGIISLSAIWLYAIITGLSPSVLRAATMFSVMAISQMRSRQGNIYNTLGFAAFILLLFDPHLIYSVGFQLSFAAVLGIVYLQPKIYSIFNFNYWIADKAWAITCVSIAAQLATFPLSAYYFHQFPTYFLVSNLLVIPSATFILVAGLLMLMADPLSGALGNAIGYCLSKFIWLLNESVSLLQHLPLSLIEWIYIDKVGLILIYGIVLTLIWGLHHRSFKTLAISALLVFCFSSWACNSYLSQLSRRELIIYEIANKTAIDHIDGFRASLFVDSLSTEELELLSFQINPHRLSSHLPPISESVETFSESGQFESFDSFICGVVASKRVLIVREPTFKFQFNETIEVDIIILEKGSIKNLKWLNDHFEYDHLVIGNKNADFYARKMKDQAEEAQIRIHSLKQDGAFILSLK